MKGAAGVGNGTATECAGAGAAEADAGVEVAENNYRSETTVMNWRWKRRRSERTKKQRGMMKKIVDLGEFAETNATAAAAAVKCRAIHHLRLQLTQSSRSQVVR